MGIHPAGGLYLISVIKAGAEVERVRLSWHVNEGEDFLSSKHRRGREALLTMNKHDRGATEAEASRGKEVKVGNYGHFAARCKMCIGLFLGFVLWRIIMNLNSPCNVTIHNRCRDTLPNCAKMKQRQQKLVLRNSSGLPNVALRAKTPMMKERPSSAIYPSDSLRQSLLGSRRGRSGLSLSKSVSTNNIAGNLNDDSPLGLRRILSQSTDSLNFRNRAMSMESLNDEGEVYYASMLEEIEQEGRDFEADSWSLAVDSSYLQTHRKDVIKRQDVIY
ncbi:hypothetical protein Z043_109070, partial [Scleropages formosus]